MEWPFVRRFKLDAVLTVNQVYLDEINRLNQELASELNSHRETKKNSNKLVEILRNDISTQQGMYEILELKNETLEIELEETKDALKIAKEDTRQHKMSLDLADEKEEKIKQYLIKVINYI